MRNDDNRDSDDDDDADDDDDDDDDDDVEDHDDEYNDDDDNGVAGILSFDVPGPRSTHISGNPEASATTKRPCKVRAVRQSTSNTLDRGKRHAGRLQQVNVVDLALGHEDPQELLTDETRLHQNLTRVH